MTLSAGALTLGAPSASGCSPHTARPPREGGLSHRVDENYGNYQLLERLATGGMAEIFLARQRGPEGFEKQLVIKRILPHLAENDASSGCSSTRRASRRG